MASHYLIVSMKSYLDFGNIGYIILCNFGGRIKKKVQETEKKCLLVAIFFHIVTIVLHLSHQMFPKFV